MGRYRKIDSRIWNDEKVASLTKLGQLSFLYVLTHPNMTALGAMRATIPGLAAELGVRTDAFRDAFRVGLLEADEKACFIGAPKFLKYNPPESINVVKAWGKSWDLIPECALKTQLWQRVKGFLDAFPQGFRDAFTEDMPYSGAGTGAGAGTGEDNMSRETRDLKAEAVQVLRFLNEKTGKHYREVESNLLLIAARLKGESKETEVDIQTCKSIIAKKVREWGTDPKMQMYLRPETLFGKTKFESYIGELICVARTVPAPSTSMPLPAPVAGGHLRSQLIVGLTRPARILAVRL